MFMVFLNPWAFLGLLSVPVLVGIYLLRNRHQRREVSSLLLWLDSRETRSGGPRIERFQFPLLFFLELLVLILLTLAATDPQIRTTKSTRPVFVILDDSYSMSAGGEDSSRSRAIQAIREMIELREGSQAHFILAGDSVRRLGEVVKDASNLDEVLKQWKCQSASANLETGLALASEIGGELSLILVVTDQPPPVTLEKGRTQWWAFGGARPNLAFVTAVRSEQSGRDRCLLELANLGGDEVTTTLHLGRAKPRSVKLAGNEIRRLTFEIPPESDEFQARIDSSDALALDDQVTLQPMRSTPVRVKIVMQKSLLRSLVEKAVKASNGASIVEERPEIIFTDEVENAKASPETWLIDMISEKETEAYLGPFILDRRHALTQGLDLEGRIWSAGKSPNLPGSPVILAGRIPLVTDEERGLRARTIHVRFRPDLSTVQASPNWPVLIANLIQWRAKERVGVARANLRLGEQTVLRLLQPRESVTLRLPSGVERSLPGNSGQVIVQGDEVGVHELIYDEVKHRVSVNALNRAESDLRSCVSGKWGDWLDRTTIQLEYRSIAWILLLFALGIVTLHLLLVHRFKRI